MSRQLPKSKYGTSVGADVFPTIAAGGLLLCAVALAIRRDDGTRKKKPFLTAEGWRRVLKLTALLAVFPFAFDFLGFPISAFVLLASMIRMFDLDRKVPVWKLLLIAAIITGAVYFTFVKLFQTQLPLGELFELIRG